MITYDIRDWSGVLLRINGSVLPKLLPRLLAIVAVSCVALYIHHYHAFRFPPVVHTMVGVALGLLLVFRTNASYDRYWEGRKLLGMMVNRVRDLCRQSGAMDFGPDLQRQLCACIGLIRLHLRDERDLAGINLTAAERTALEPIKNRHIVYLGWITRRVQNARQAGTLDPMTYLAMDTNFTSLMDQLGACERIVRTPVPFAYAQHIKGFLFLFCYSVPFVLVDQTVNFTPLAAAAIAYALFGIEEIGVEIEDPFGDDPNDLPLDAIEKNLIAATSEMVTEPTGPA